jgi:hypothetical protein
VRPAERGFSFCAPTARLLTHAWHAMAPVMTLIQIKPRCRSGVGFAVMDRNGIFFRLSIAWLVFLAIAIFYVVAH